MSESITALLDEIEQEYGIEFIYDVRVAVEARAYLTRLGFPFNLESLFRAILRDGFQSGSAFHGLGTRLTPRAKTARTDPSRQVEDSRVPDEIVRCLHTAARICRHFSQIEYISGQQTFRSDKGHLAQDAIVFAIARVCPDIITANLSPRKTAEWIKITSQGMAWRALSDLIGPARMYSLSTATEVEGFLHERNDLSGWRVRVFIARGSDAEHNRWVHISMTENLGAESPFADDADGADGALAEPVGKHAILWFSGVSRVGNCPQTGELQPPLETQSAYCKSDAEGVKHFVLALEPESAADADIAPQIEVEFRQRLTVDEHVIKRPSDVGQSLSDKTGAV